MKIDISIKEIDGEGYLCIKLADLTVLKRARKFKPPSLKEVKEYCKERNNQVNPQKWMNHYESNGWMVGRNKMKDWKAAVRTWEQIYFAPDLFKGANGKVEKDELREDYGKPSDSAVTRQQYLEQKNQGK